MKKHTDPILEHGSTSFNIAHIKDHVPDIHGQPHGEVRHQATPANASDLTTPQDAVPPVVPTPDVGQQRCPGHSHAAYPWLWSLAEC